MIAMSTGGVHPSPPCAAVSRLAGVPTVSVIMPSLNVASYIREAIDSALAQAHPVLEVIVVDGGSKDGTRELVAGYGEPVRLVDQSRTGRKGIGAARNLGIAAASGEWVAFLDADDWWDPGKIAEQFAALDKCPGAALSYTGVCLVSEPSGERYVYIPRGPDEIWPRLRWNNELGTSTVIVKRSVLLELGGFREDLASCEDWELWVRLRMHNYFVCCPSPLSFYRVVTNSTSHELERHLDAIPQVEGAMLEGLSGWRRWVAQRRFWAGQIYGGMVIARENGSAQARSLLWQSLAHWPFPTFLPVRYKALLMMLLRRRRPEGTPSGRPASTDCGRSR
jgi:glycosyltransferase involved in cell wall biosynthesis